jgi:hypothetical protein
MSVYAVVFLIRTAVWCFAGRFFATRPLATKALSRWGHVLLPAVLIAIGLLISSRGTFLACDRSGNRAVIPEPAIKLRTISSRRSEGPVSDL